MPVGATLAVAGAGLAGAAITSSASKSAAKTQAAAANQATDFQKQVFDTTQANLAPYNQFGQSAQGALGKLLGLDQTGNGAAAPQLPTAGDPNVDAWLKANPDVVNYYNNTPAAQTVSLADFAQNVARQQAGIRSAIKPYTAQDVADWRSPQDQALEQLPGYRFARDQGVQQVNRQIGSMGLTGAQAKGIARFVTGLADQTYGNQVQRLQGAANTGEAAAAGQASTGASQGGSIANTIVGAGTASAAGTVGAANSIASGLSSIPNALIFNKLFTGSGGGSAGGGAGIYTGAGTEGGNLG